MSRAFVGSANWTKSSLTNIELVVELDLMGGGSESLEQWWHAAWSDSEPAT